MSDIKEAKKKAQDLVNEAINARVETLQNIGAIDYLEVQVRSHSDHAYHDDSLRFDSSGLLESVIELDLGDLEDEDKEVIEQILERLSDSYAGYGHYDETWDTWSYSQCLGDAVIFNVSPDRNCYAIHSPCLELKVNSVVSEGHGWALIEQAMRRNGYFPDVVSTDYYGTPTLETMPDDIRQASDDYLRGYIDACNEVES